MAMHMTLQGERRFYLGAVVDDLFLTTGSWVYDPANFFEGQLVRPLPSQPRLLCILGSHFMWLHVFSCVFVCVPSYMNVQCLCVSFISRYFGILSTDLPVVKK